jgi:choline dehydrogenase-like flavoprotein
MTEADVTIIGAGAGGGAAAWALTRRGLSVSLLEAGPRFDPDADFRLDRPDWEVQRFPYKPGSLGEYRFGDLQALDPRWDSLRSWNANFGRFNRGDHRRPADLGYYHVRGVGGSTLRYTGEAHRLNRHAMRMHSRFGVAADWPIDYEALEPWYRLAEDIIGVAGPGESDDRPGAREHLQPAHPLGSAGRCLAKGAGALGMTWVANDRAALSRAREGRPACNYCGNCNRGGPRRDKGSADMTFIREAEATGRLQLTTGVQVTRLLTDDAGRITAVRTTDAQGNHETQAVNHLVLAGGAVESPRLLLASANDHFPRGLANRTGHVGKHFMETLFWTSSALAELPLASFKCLPSDSICWDFNRPDGIDGIIGGCRFSVATNESDFCGPIQYAQRVVGGFGQGLKRGVREQLGKVVSVGAIGESLPNPGSYVDLHPSDREPSGLPLARIHSHLDDRELTRLAFMADTCRRLLKAAGTSTPFEEYGTYDHFASTHVFGTCRMGQDPADSVVDERLRSFDHDNLYIMDASVFPSSGGGESPSLTISALALRAGDLLANRVTQT